MGQVRRLRGSRPRGATATTNDESIRVQRRASNSGVIMVCGEQLPRGCVHPQTLTIWVGRRSSPPGRRRAGRSSRFVLAGEGIPYGVEP
jgi:hypothetical protein